MFFVIIYTKNIYPTDAKTTVGVEVLARTLCFLSELTPKTYPTDVKNCPVGRRQKLRGPPCGETP